MEGFLMTAKLVIPGRLPGLNEYIAAERGHLYAAANMKKKTQGQIIRHIKQQLRGIAFDRTVDIHYLWVESNQRRDKDNVAFGKKFIQDALVEAGILKNDGWRDIGDFWDEFDIDPKNPRVVVTIEERKTPLENLIS